MCMCIYVCVYIYIYIYVYTYIHTYGASMNEEAAVSDM